MKAAVVHVEPQTKRLVYEDAPTPIPMAGFCLVKVEAAGICGSDLHGYLDAAGTSRAAGLIIGHEVAGTVEATGEGVDALRLGDRVTVDPQVTCGNCNECRHGLISICANKQVLGSSLRGFQQGGMADYILVAANRLHILPDNVDAASGALIEPLANALHVVNRHHFSIGDVVVILGSGSLGLLQLMCVKLIGAGIVICTDTNPAQLEMARRLGADRTVNVSEESLEPVVEEMSSGRGADVVIESVGISATYTQAIMIARRRGTVLVFGAITSTIEVPLLPILHKELHLVGCTGANDEDTATAIRLLANGQLDVHPLLTHTYPLSEADAAFRNMADPSVATIKTQLIP